MKFLTNLIKKCREIGTTAVAFIIGLLVAFSFEEGLFPIIIAPLVNFIGNPLQTYVLICVVGIIILWYILERNPLS